MMSSSNSSEKQEMMRGSCEDCGNKAKRDCEHMRCRTCCNSRGLPCPTHVRSTWIPAARRRRLHHQRLSSSSAASFPRPLSLLTTGFEERSESRSLPAELTAVASFRYVRVSSEDNAVDQAAYQTSVNIGGRSFQGILYDHGPSSSSSPNHQYQYQHQHHLGGDGASTSAGGFPAPSALYGPPYNPFLPTAAAGMQLFFQPNQNHRPG